MADYLTLLAQRSLGEFTPVEPVRHHPFADVRSAGDGVVEEEAFAGTKPGTTIAAGLDGGGGGVSGPHMTGTTFPQTSSPSPARGEEGPVSPAAPEVTSDLLYRRVESNSRSDSRGVSPADRGPRLGEPPASIQRDGIEDRELLVPDYRDRSHEIRGRDPRGERNWGDAEIDRPSAVALRLPASPDLVTGRSTHPPEAPNFEADADAPLGRPVVEVSIGTIEIRAVTPKPPPPAPRARRVRPGLGLEDYLEQRRRGER